MEKPENIGKAVLTEDGSYMIEVINQKIYIYFKKRLYI